MDYLNYIFVDRGDKRVYDWPLMASPYKILFFELIYILTVIKWLPNYMKHRQPYNLKTFMCFYNLLQVIACIYILCGYINVGYDATAAFTCKGNNLNIPNIIKINATKLTYKVMYLKMIEFIETIIFALRKSDRQITKLHLYHHLSTVLLAWIVVKYVGTDGLPIYPIFINTIVHVFMYTYYFITIYDKTINPKFMNIFKKSITIIQLTQFVILIAQAIIVHIRGCGVPFGVLLTYTPNIILLLFAFYNFYKKTYFNKKKLIK